MPNRPDCQHCAANGVCLFTSDAQRLIRDRQTPSSAANALIAAIQEQPTGVVLEQGTRRPLCSNPDGCNRRLSGNRAQWLARGR